MCVSLSGVGDRHEQAHGPAGQLEDDGRDTQDLWHRDAHARHVQRAYSGTSVVPRIYFVQRYFITNKNSLDSSVAL